MYLGTALGLIAIGAILAFAVEFDLGGINIKTVGIILMVVGAIGAILALTMTSRSRTTGGTREVVRERDTI